MNAPRILSSTPGGSRDRHGFLGRLTREGAAAAVCAVGAPLAALARAVPFRRGVPRPATLCVALCPFLAGVPCAAEGAGASIEALIRDAGGAEEDAVRILRKIGIDRILFGSDSPPVAPQPQWEQILRLPLSDEEKQMILAGNSQRILHF